MNKTIEKMETAQEIVSLTWLFKESTRTPDIVRETEKIYRGLGVPVLYGVLSILANKSVFFIGGRGLGKTRVIKSIPYLPDAPTSKWDTFTLGELSAFCGKHEEPNDIGVRNSNFVFKVGDFSTFSEYHREIFLTVCSKIISDGEYIHITEMTPHLSFEDCRLTMLIAIQPKLYSLLCNRYTQWESMAYDRFTKFLLINPLRQGKTVDTPFLPTLPRKIPPSATISDNIDLTCLISLFGNQVSEGRAQLYARDYAIAMARFQGKESVDQSDVNTFYKLFSPYLDTFSKLQHRETLEEAIMVSSGHMEVLTEIGKHLEGIVKSQLSTSLKVTEDHIGRCLSFLVEKGVARKEQDKYCLSTDLEQFFKWYRDTFSSEISASSSSAKGD